MLNGVVSEYSTHKTSGMDTDNLEAARRSAPAHGTASVGLLLDFVAGLEGQSVVDPYYGGPAGFVAIWKQVDSAAAALMARLTSAG